MTGRSAKQNLVKKNPYRQKAASRNSRRPLWLPASNFYMLAAAISLAMFFLFWGILGEGDPAPWIPAGILASSLLIIAVLLREVILRKARENFLLGQERLERNVRQARPSVSTPSDPAKLTLELNQIILREIEQKSEAARVLAKLPEGHLNVFELCDEYLKKNKSELQTISPYSPRRNPLLKSRGKIKTLHKYHLLAWASIETRLLTQDSRVRATIDEKLETVQKASSVLESAMQFYPEERQLIESAKAIREYTVSIKVSHLIEQAEKAAFLGNVKRAVNHYRDALFFLASDNERTPERDQIAETITTKIDKLRTLKGNR